MRGLGTLVNVATVLAGTAVGLVAGRRVPDRMRETVLSGIGLLTIGVGIASFLATENAVFPVVSIVIGGVIGESLRLDDRMVAEMEATGGPMIVGIGLLLLNIKRIRLASLLPGLAVAPVLVAIFAT